MGHQRRLKKDLLRGRGKKHHRVPIIEHKEGKKAKIVGWKSLIAKLCTIAPKKG